jgi:hypothetical protein
MRFPFYGSKLLNRPHLTHAPHPQQEATCAAIAPAMRAWPGIAHQPPCHKSCPCHRLAYRPHCQRPPHPFGPAHQESVCSPCVVRLGTPSRWTWPATFACSYRGLFRCLCPTHLRPAKSKSFFEQGAALLAQYPALYAELAGFYQVKSISREH